tara:strand:- start:344 stop:598 length:255 start_codon:yes stop_codon:yes gene_type:complete
MIIIFGNGFKEYSEAKGKFVCPNCKITQIYEVKTQREFFKLFFIPIWPISEKSKPVVECKCCMNCFNTNILKKNNYYLDGNIVQ